MSKQTSVWVSILASLFLLIFIFSAWFYGEVFNKNSFQKHVVAGLTTQQSRDALAALIIDKSFERRPVIKTLLQEQIQPALSGILDAPRVENLIISFSGKVHDALFSRQPTDIIINLAGIKIFVNRLMGIAESVSDKDLKGIQIPDSIIIFRAGEIPSILDIGMLLLWIGPITLVVFIALFSWMLWKANDKKYAVSATGASIIIESIILLGFGIWYQPILLSRFGNPNVKIIIDQIYSQFSVSLVNIFQYAIFGGFLLILAAFGYKRFSKRK